MQASIAISLSSSIYSKLITNKNFTFLEGFFREKELEFYFSLLLRMLEVVVNAVNFLASGFWLFLFDEQESYPF
jgi:hypothetical protein